MRSGPRSASRRPLTRVSRAFRVLATGLLSAALIVSGATLPAQAQDAPAVVADTAIKPATLVGFDPGNIISDAVFYNSATMSTAKVQSFLNSKVTACSSGYTCLKDYRTTSVSQPANPMCNAYTGAANETAAAIIAKVSAACGINPQVLLVTLEKEQSLVRSTAPSEHRYRIAMGYACPDTAACDTQYYGFFNQTYHMARQLKRYSNPPGMPNTFTWYAPGKTWNLLFHPNKACGTSPVHIKNQATANLYYYTPYQPNAASLRAGYGTGDACSSYGNRNFYNLFTDWFGSTQVSPPVQWASVGIPEVNGSFVVGQRLTASAGSWDPAPTSTSYQWLRNGSAVSGATAATYAVTNADAGKSLAVRVTVRRDGLPDKTAQSTAAQVRGVAVSRVSGADRYATAVAVSKKTRASAVSRVFVATGLDYADALTASAAAAREGAGLLLLPRNHMPDVVATELRRLKPSEVVVVGGTGALDSGTEGRIRSALASVSPSVKVTRLAGTDRYDTGRKVIARTPSAATVYLTVGTAFPDALSAASVAGGSKSPVILVDPRSSRLDDATMAQITRMKAKTAVIVGGEGAIPASVAAQLTTAKLTVKRYGGLSRYETNANLLRATGSAVESVAYVATGTDFPDALAGSLLAAVKGAPLFLVGGSCITPAFADYVRDRATTSAQLIGGTGVLSPGLTSFTRC